MSRGFEVIANQFDDYKVGKLVDEDFVLFICSTTNQGDEPSMIRNFWRFIMRKGLPDNVLNNVKCAVIGLGDSSYLKYNVVAKKLYKRLINLGVQMLLDICLGDDQHDLGLDAAVDKWLPNFWNKIEQYFESNENNNQLTTEYRSFQLYDVKIVDSNSSNQSDNQEQSNESKLISKNSLELQIEYNKENYYQSEVISNTRLTSVDHFQDTRFIKLAIPSKNNSLNHLPGDVVMILPQNSKENVDKFLNLLNLDRNKLIKIKRKNKNFLGFNLFDTIEDKEISIEQLVKQYFDLSSIPKRSFFEILSTYATDQLEKDKLTEFASTNGQYALYEYCKRPKRNLLEVLIDFPKVTENLKIDHLFQLINPIFPRPYSIANSIEVYPREIHVLCAVKQLKTLLKMPRLGLCSNYIKNLKVGDQISIYVRKGTLKIPNDKLPLIMIGPGTGVAPLRSIIQDRINKKQASNFLFFGCRNHNKDFYFKDEWAQTNALGLLYYYVAFSRDQTDKIYVQDKLWENRKLIWELLFKCDAHIIVTGSGSQMPKDVREMLIKILEDQGGHELNNKAKMVLERFETSKKLQFECWD